MADPGPAGLGRLVRLGLGLRSAAALAGLPSAAVLGGAAGATHTTALLLAAVVSTLQAVAGLALGDRALRLPLLLAVDLPMVVALYALSGPAYPLLHYAAGTAALAGLLRGPAGLPVAVALAVATTGLVGIGPDAAAVPPLHLAAALAGSLGHATLRRLESLAAELAAARAGMAAAAERDRLAAEVHDTLAADLHGLGLSGRVLAAALAGPGPRPAAAATLAADLADGLDAAQQGARALLGRLRGEAGPPPGPLDREVTALVADRAGGLAARTRIAPAGPVAADTRTEVLRVLGEALANVRRHARATRVEVELARAGPLLRLRVADDGAGFDPALVAAGRFGLLGMAERARRAGGSLRVTSVPGRGTTVLLEVPAAGPGGRGG